MSIVSDIVEVSNVMPRKVLDCRVLKLVEEVGEIAEALNKDQGTQQFIDECADAMIVIVDMVNQIARATNLDAEATLQEAVQRKLKRWQTKYGENKAPQNDNSDCRE